MLDLNISDILNIMNNRTEGNYKQLINTLIYNLIINFKICFSLLFIIYK